MTEELFRSDAYLKTCEATVLRVGPEGIVLDRTVFYPEGGGQLGDTGTLALPGSGETVIADTRVDRASGEHRHIPTDGAALPATGDAVTCAIDWDRRYRHMRVHTAMHLMCAVIDGAVTGGQVGDGKGRLDFDLPDTSLDKAAIGAALNDLIAADLPVGAEWIADEELAARPDLVRTLSVKPPMGAGSVRLLRIGDAANTVDLQPCGGTHVARTGEIGPVAIGKIENKGRRNRRVNLRLAE
ncbi:MAG: alanyl-tRNA editing protein [Rhodospirillaceae bacterium]|nr:alanyl-tRNA editing protein [Rhodospirillaceae bacterium]MDE0618127.1 alanyl-tRNA editing protein [Rhodospirillaceae bacterium]